MDMSRVCHGADLLTLLWIADHPERGQSLVKKLAEWLVECLAQTDGDTRTTLIKRPKNIRQILKLASETDTLPKRGFSESPLTKYLNMNQFTEFQFDNCFHNLDGTELPKEIFRCKHLKHLSLRSNHLHKVPADIGRLQQLEYLALTNNLLKVRSIPYTIVFCVSLTTLLLDYNRLDALPACLLEIPSLTTVHRIGQYTNDFTATNCPTLTSMPTHREVNHRILPDTGTSDHKPGTSLAYWATRAVLASKNNFLDDDSVPSILKDFICDIYEEFNVCHKCETAAPIHKSGFKVISFKSSYLGNSCVPFEYWVCSIDCARSVDASPRSDESTRREIQTAFDLARGQHLVYITPQPPSRKCTLL